MWLSHPLLNDDYWLPQGHFGPLANDLCVLLNLAIWHSLSTDYYHLPAGKVNMVVCHEGNLEYRRIALQAPLISRGHFLGVSPNRPL